MTEMHAESVRRQKKHEDAKKVFGITAIVLCICGASVGESSTANHEIRAHVLSCEPTSTSWAKSLA